MCTMDCVNKISNFLKVPAGKLGYNTDKIVTRTSKSNETLSGFSTIVSCLTRESKEISAKNSLENLETQCLVSQWLDYSVLFVTASKDKHVTNTLLKELNSYLSTKSYLVGNKITIADVAVFYSIAETMNNLSTFDKENNINLSRWFDHLQQQKPIMQGNNSTVNFSTIFLLNWASGTHI